MQTPPPTRGTSTRKKLQQPRMYPVVATPSTIASRRNATPHENWLKKPSEATYPEASPFALTPLQFPSPPTFQFHEMGAMTAPAYPQFGLLWDPQSDVQFNQASPSIMVDHGFQQNFTSPAAGFYASQTPPSHQQPMLASQTLSVTAPRPQSAMPFLANRPSTSHPPSSSHLGSPLGIDPSAVWTDHGLANRTSARPLSVQSFSAVESSQPYQQQASYLQREKADRQRRFSKQQSRLSGIDTAPFRMPEGGLRRSLTESARFTVTTARSAIANLLSLA